MNSNRWIALAAIAVFLLISIPPGLVPVLAVAAVVLASGAVVLRFSGLSLPRRGAGQPSRPVKLETPGIDTNQLVELFGGELPDNWQRLMSGVLDVLESVARFEVPRLVGRATARALWVDGPAPTLVRTGTAVFARFGTVQLTDDEADDAHRSLTALLTDADGRRVELTWSVETTPGLVARKLTAAQFIG